MDIRHVVGKASPVENCPSWVLGCPVHLSVDFVAMASTSPATQAYLSIGLLVQVSNFRRLLYKKVVLSFSAMSPPAVHVPWCQGLGATRFLN